ncbi:MAG: hypothetical protein ACR2IV_04370 [Bryobacteraceae bacterium]
MTNDHLPTFVIERTKQGITSSGEVCPQSRHSDEAYSDWVNRREAEDELNAEIAEHEQAGRWHEFRRDDEEQDGDLLPGRLH